MIEEKQPFDNAQGKEAGWEFTVPKFLLNPVAWIVFLAIIGFTGYTIANKSTTQTITDGDPIFKALCIKEKGEDAWMKMKPIRNGKVLSDQTCWGCMVDENNMICDKSEYESFIKKYR